MGESIQHKLDRVRPPRVQITYDVEIGDAVEKKELPFVMGIVADLSGNPVEPLPKMKERRFVEIDRDNFNDVMKSSGARVETTVANKLSPAGGRLKVELEFKEIEDFDPMSIVEQMEPLRKLYETRRRLADLLTKLDGNDELESLLKDVVSNTEGMQTIRNEAAVDNGGEG